MKLRIALLVATIAIALSAQANPMIQSVQEALKDQGFYYGEITGEKNADTAAAVRRYQIRNGLQITGDLNDETLKSLGVDSSGARTIVKASPTTAPAAPATPATSDLRDDQRQNDVPANPLTGEPFPNQPQDRSASAKGQSGSDLRRDEQPPTRPDYGAIPAQPGENFAGTPYQGSPPQVQQNIIVSAQNILARQGLYRGMIDGIGGPEFEFALRAYQARVRLPVTGRLDLKTLAALQLLPGGNAPVYVPRRYPSREEPVRGEWIPEH